MSMNPKPKQTVHDEEFKKQAVHSPRMAQLLLIPDARPLEQRMGRDFFRQAPRRTGVYLMKDADDEVVYVGKAKDLRQRLSRYRIANPDRMPRRQLRLLRRVERIEFQFCATDSAAFAREAKLLRSLKPRFNRAGVWPGKVRFLAWCFQQTRMRLLVVEVPKPGWQRFGPLGSRAIHVHRSLMKLLWLAVDPMRKLVDWPAGWAHDRFMDAVELRCGEAAAQVSAGLDAYFWGRPMEFLVWLGRSLKNRGSRFERQAIEAELEVLEEFANRRSAMKSDPQQLALL